LVPVTLLGCMRGEIRDLSGFIRCDRITIPKDMKCIPGGPFIRGSDTPSLDEETWANTYDESPQEKVVISTFLMDTDEVSTADYQKCADAGACDP
jgi:formylglycine-generating enzyme required for sulfatase activity